MGSIVQFVLNCSKELSSEIGVGIVVDACNEDVCHLLIQVALATADVPNALQQLTEIPIAFPFQPVIIQRKPFLDKFTQMLCRPLLCAAEHKFGYVELTIM